MRSRNALSLGVLFTLLLAGGGGYFIGRLASPPTLRSVAEARGVYIGVSTGSGYFEDPRYTELLKREFDLITTENALKFEPVHPERERYDFADADAIVAFAEAHHLRVRGHTLVWQNQLPTWLTAGTWTRQELMDILKEHIYTVVGRYRGRIYAWDVVNEGMGDDARLFENFWYQGIGPDYIDLAFQWAHEADPNALLFFNEHNSEGLNAKSEAVYAYLQELLRRGVPVDGVGLEMHYGVGWGPKADALAYNIRRLGELGLQVHLTEVDFRIKLPGEGQPADAAALAKQAERYRGAMQACLSAPNCTAFVLWGLTDAHSWIPYFYPDWGAALIFDEDYAPKPAYHALLEALQGSER